MDSQQAPPLRSRSLVVRTLHNAIHRKTRSSTFCFFPIHHENEIKEKRNRAAMEAFVSQLFAAVSSLKSSYAQLQIETQFPFHDKKAFESADERVVDEFQVLSELKRRFVKGEMEINSTPPYMTVMLSEVEEQQSLINIHVVMLRKLQMEMQEREAKIVYLKRNLCKLSQSNGAMEKKVLNSCVLEGVKFSDLNLNHFEVVLDYGLKSIRSFVKLLMLKMESSNWDSDEVVKAILVTEDFTLYREDREFKAFELQSFICREMFAGFSDRSFGAQKEENFPGESLHRRRFFFQQFQQTRSVHQNPNSSFGKFLKSKYLRVIHPKMESSFFGNLNQRTTVESGRFPATEFFEMFAEMGWRIWLLHRFGFSIADKVGIFEPKRGSRFSPVFMESVTGDVISCDGKVDFTVALTVVPGFKLRRTVVQSQVYLHSPETPAC